MISIVAGCMLHPVDASAAPQSLLVVDANTGATLIGQAADEPRAPASLAKMMTLYLVFEALERGSVTMKTPIRISPRAADAAPSKLGLDAGETIALEDAIKALITKSANDIAVAVAEHISGSEEAFARAMTSKAAEIGMPATTFKNASGLPDGGQLTTARDMVTLGLRLHDRFPRRFAMFATRAFTYDDRTYKNHNTLMLHMPGINGIKTGYTSASGFNLVTSYESDGRHLIAAIFGGETAARRNAAMRVALTRAVSRASTAKTRKPMLVADAKPKAQALQAPGLRVPVPVIARRPEPAPKPVAVPPAAPALALPPPPVPVEVHEVAVPSPVRVPVGARIEMAKVRPVDVAPPNAPVAFRDGGRELPAAAPPAGRLAATPATATLSPVSLGRPPGSLNEQHVALSGASVPPPSYRLAGPPHAAPAPGPVAATGGGYDIQIGAFATAEEADRAIASVQTRSQHVVAGRWPVRRQVTVGGKTLQRARFSGFDRAGAADACADLARQQVSCIVMRTE